MKAKVKILRWVKNLIFGILIGLAIIGLGFLPYYIGNIWWTAEQFKNSGPVGDTIGGILGPFIGLISGVLVYFAFREQVKANKIVSDQLNFDRIDRMMIRIEDSRTKFEEICKTLNQELVLPPINIQFRESLMKDLNDQPQLFAEQIEELDKKVIKVLEQHEIVDLSKEFMYVLQLLTHTAMSLKTAEKIDKIRFISLYEIYFERDLHMFEPMIQKFNVDTSEEAYYTNKILAEIKYLSTLTTELQDSIQVS